MSSLRKISSFRLQTFAGKRVLLVDDHTNIRSIISGILNGLGMTKLTTAERGDQALATLQSEPFDLLITDYEMPGLSGVTLAQRIRSEARSKNPRLNFAIPIIMVTSHATKSCLTQARDAGVDEFLVKPFTTIAVADRLDVAINHRRQFIVSNHYIGPCRRRLIDDVLADLKRRAADREEQASDYRDAQRENIRDEAEMISKLAASSETSLVALDAVVATAKITAERSAFLRDTLLERAAASLIRYVHMVPQDDAIDAAVVEMHGHAVKQLLDLAGRDLDLSNQVVASLEKAVSKKLRVNAA